MPRLSIEYFIISLILRISTKWHFSKYRQKRLSPISHHLLTRIALTRGRTDHCGRCYLFTVSHSRLLLRNVTGTSFPNFAFIALSAERWTLILVGPWTLTNNLGLRTWSQGQGHLNQCAKYLGQTLFVWNLLHGKPKADRHRDRITQPNDCILDDDKMVGKNIDVNLAEILGQRRIQKG